MCYDAACTGNSSTKIGKYFYILHFFVFDYGLFISSLTLINTLKNVNFTGSKSGTTVNVYCGGCSNNSNNSNSSNGGGSGGIPGVNQTNCSDAGN
jgi:hypothetical protein